MNAGLASSRSTTPTAGMTLVEVMVGLAVGLLIAAALAMVFVTGLFNFAGLGNYASLTGQSHISLDRMSRELRAATAVVRFQADSKGKTLVLTNGYEGTTITYSWDPATTELACEKTGEARQVLLTGCDAWDFSFYQRAPKGNYTFYPTTSLATCKLVNMSWKCSRSILQKKVNTEYVVTAQVVLRNKP